MSDEAKNIKNKKAFKLQHWHQIALILMAYDVTAVTMSYFLALLMRFDFNFSAIPSFYLQCWEYSAPFYALMCLTVFTGLRLYRSIWRFASYTEFRRIILASILTTIMQVVISVIVLFIMNSTNPYASSRMPLSYYIMGAITQFVLVTGIRFSYRFVLLLRDSRRKKSAANIMLIGLDSIIGTTQGIYWNFSNSGILAPNQIIRSGVGELQPVVY